MESMARELDPYKCEVTKGCKLPAEVIYLGYNVCEYHWEKHCNDGSFSLKKVFKIKDQKD